MDISTFVYYSYLKRVVCPFRLVYSSTCLCVCMFVYLPVCTYARLFVLSCQVRSYRVRFFVRMGDKSTSNSKDEKMGKDDKRKKKFKSPLSLSPSQFSPSSS